jgi:4-hydroxy-2-oxoheptanedioate aldolase
MDRLLDLLSETSTAVGTFSVLADPFAAEVLARAGFDFVLIDLQHGFSDLGNLANQLRAVEAVGSAPLVRVRTDSPAEIGAALDYGAWAVIVPYAENPDAARAAVAACRYSPSGSRSFGPFRSRTNSTTTLTNAVAPCFVMVESGAAVESIDEITTVPGLAGVFVGPTDLAMSLGLGPDYSIDDHAHSAAIVRVAEACRHNGVLAAIQTSNAEEASLRLGQGYSLVSMRSDYALLNSSAERLIEGLLSARSVTADVGHSALA